MIPIIGIAAKAGAGKSTLGKIILEEAQGGRQFAFATKLKETCTDLLGMSFEDMNTDEGKSCKTSMMHEVCPSCGGWNTEMLLIDNREQLTCVKCGAVGHPKVFQQPWTNRELLQYMGDKIRYAKSSVWADFVLNQIKDLSALKKGKPKYAVITDCRYRSEIDAVRAAGGVVWRLKRPQTDTNQVGIAGHASESELDKVPESLFSCVIVNDGTLEDLRSKTVDQLQRFLRERDN
jgi:hypothetical protein